MLDRLRGWWWVHALAAVLAIPFILRQNAWYEWANAYWLLQLQTQHVLAHGLPTYFIHAPDQAFYPFHLFYAGPLVAVLAYPATVLGSWHVFELVTAMAFVSVSAGVGWTARNLGVGPGLAAALGLLATTTPYLVGDLYDRGAWAELVAAAGACVALGAGSALVLRPERPWRVPFLTLALASAVVAGTHNLTFAMSAVAIPVLLLALVLAVGRFDRATCSRLFVAGAGALLGIGLTAAFLLPNLWLSGDTWISQDYAALYILHKAEPYDVATFLSPWLTTDSSGNVHLQPSVAAVALILVVGVWAVARRRLERYGAAGVFALLGIALIGMLLAGHPGWWLDFPRSLQVIQFPYRLMTYVTLALVLAAAVLVARSGAARRRWVVGLVVVAVAWQGALAMVVAVDSSPASTAVAGLTTPSTVPGSFPKAWQGRQFHLVRGDLVKPRTYVSVPTQTVRPPDEIHIAAHDPMGTMVATNIVASPLIRVDGDAIAVGRDDGEMLVLRVTDVHDGAWQATVRPVCGGLCLGGLTGGAPFAVFAGRIVSLAALLGLLAIAAWPLIRRAQPWARSALSHAPGRMRARS